MEKNWAAYKNEKRAASKMRKICHYENGAMGFIHLEDRALVQ